LIIRGAQPSDSGVYDVVVSDQCGSVVSRPAVLSVRACPGAPTGDMNGDGLVDGDDVQTFVTDILFRPNDPPAICFGDFSGNGLVDAPDVPAFVAALLGG